MPPYKRLLNPSKLSNAPFDRVDESNSVDGFHVSGVGKRKTNFPCLTCFFLPVKVLHESASGYFEQSSSELAFALLGVEACYGTVQRHWSKLSKNFIEKESDTCSGIAFSTPNPNDPRADIFSVA